MILLGAAVGTIVAQIVTIMLGFFIVLWILAKFAWNPIIKTIDDRRELVIKEFETIDQKQALLASQIKDYEERLRQIDGEARERMNKAIEEGRKSAGEIVEEARVQAEEMKRKAAADIKMEIDKARVELRNEIVNLTIGASEKLMRAELNDERQRQLVGNFITELENRKAS